MHSKRGYDKAQLTALLHPLVHASGITFAGCLIEGVFYQIDHVLEARFSGTSPDGLLLVGGTTWSPTNTLFSRLAGSRFREELESNVTAEPLSLTVAEHSSKGLHRAAAALTRRRRVLKAFSINPLVEGVPHCAVLIFTG